MQLYNETRRIEEAHSRIRRITSFPHRCYYFPFFFALCAQYHVQRVNARNTCVLYMHIHSYICIYVYIICMHIYILIYIYVNIQRKKQRKRDREGADEAYRETEKDTIRIYVSRYGTTRIEISGQKYECNGSPISHFSHSFVLYFLLYFTVFLPHSHVATYSHCIFPLATNFSVPHPARVYQHNKINLVFIF